MKGNKVPKLDELSKDILGERGDEVITQQAKLNNCTNKCIPQILERI